MNNNNWFASWFDSKYYHVLYKNRDFSEAQNFIDNLTKYLNLSEDSRVLDLACGKGRHSKYLNQLGFDVTGVDLSENSINFAKQFENEHLRFRTHDMREPINETYDAVLNLFTSFGYFDEVEDNHKTIRTIKNAINEFGLGVIDFFNAEFVLENLVEKEVKLIDEIEFHITKRVENKNIIKTITFEDQGEKYSFREKVTAFTLTDFEEILNQNDMYLLDTFGDYKLRKYYKNQSERLIMVIK